jgi:hypothetical protein
MGKQDYVCGVLRLHCVPLRKTNGKTLGNDYLRVILSGVVDGIEGSHGETGLRLWGPSAPLRSAQEDKWKKALGMTVNNRKTNNRNQKTKLKKFLN